MMIVAHVRALPTAGSGDNNSGNSWFLRTDARVKIVGTFALVVGASLATHTEIVVTALVLAMVVAILSGVSLRRLTIAYASAVPFIAFASFSVFLFSGWETGLVMMARTSSCVILLLLLALGTETFDLFTGLRRLKVPGLVTTLLMLTSRFIIILSDEFERMKTSRKARGFSGGKSLLDRGAMKVISFTAGMVLVRAFARADRIYEGLRCKAFERDMKPWRTRPLGVADVVVLLTLLTAACLLTAAQYQVIG
jgi:cobalt/nickel transport system permease protein